MATSEKILVKSKSGLRMLCVDEKLASPFTLEEPPWSEECSFCENVDCKLKFDILKRKHHCRRCGKCFCNTCCNNMITLHRMGFIDPVRHCRSCFNITKKENEFFEKHIKTLTFGGHFRRHPDDSSDVLPGGSFTCTLSSDQRYIHLESDGETIEKIFIDKIESVQLAAATVDQLGNRMATGIAIRYTKSVDNSVMLKMDVDDGIHRMPSMFWVAALQKAFMLVHESRKISTTT
ncbi:unnamed protein product [Lymnaea stagnalis]|uniref:FYVE-type domain-containing protein n=1 Tax=Lymnaea stagnalis TaxID=6523 RepID=A0AAV2H1P6_LYMST